MAMTPAQIAATQTIALGVLEAIDESGAQGAPSGVLYAALMTQGCTLNQFQSLMATMERPKFVIKDGDCYVLTQEGRNFKNKLAQVVPAAKTAIAA